MKRIGMKIISMMAAVIMIIGLLPAAGSVVRAAETYRVTLIAYDNTNGTEEAGGEVAFSDTGKGSTISGDYDENSSRTIGVYPAENYKFTGWAKDTPTGEIVSSENPYTFTVTENVTLYALFESDESAPAADYTLTGVTHQASGYYSTDGEEETWYYAQFDSAPVLEWEGDGVDCSYLATPFHIDSSLDSGLHYEPKDGETYYFAYYIFPNSSVDLSIDFSKVDDSKVNVTLEGFELQLIKNEQGIIEGPTDCLWLLFSAVKTASAPAATYPVWVGSTQVTDANKTDILEDGGKAKFDPATNTLTLNNPTISGEHYYSAIYAQGIDLTMEGSASFGGSDVGVYVSDGSLSLNGDFTIFGGTALFVKSDITVTGGKMTVNGDHTGIEMNAYDSTLTVTGGELEVTGRDGIIGYNGGSNLKVEGGTVTIDADKTAIDLLNATFSGGTVTAEGNAFGIVLHNKLTIENGITSVTADGSNTAVDCKGISIGDQLIIKEPEGGKISDDGTNIKNEDGTIATHVLIVPGAAVTHTVTFESNGGTPVPAAQTVADGEKAVEPEKPSREGLEFGGWYRDSEMTEPFDFDTPITGDITLYARWNQYIADINIVKVWDDNDDAAGKRPDSIDVKVLADGTEITTATLTRDKGWKTLFVYASGTPDVELTCEEIVPEGYTLLSNVRKDATITLTNQYGVTPPAPAVYKVTFDANGGSGSMSDMTVNEGEKLTLPDNGFTAPEGKEFDKWDAGVPGEQIEVSADMTVKALWKDKEPAPTEPEHHHEHNFVWEVTKQPTPEEDGEMVYACTVCGTVSQRLPISGYVAFNEDAAAKIRNAHYGAEVLIRTEKWISFYSVVWDELAKRPDVSLAIDFRSLDKMYEVVVPAGTDVKALKNEEGYAGFLFLSGRFGRRQLQVR